MLHVAVLAGLPPGRNFTVGVEAINAIGSSGVSGAPRFYTTLAPPQSPSHARTVR